LRAIYPTHESYHPGIFIPTVFLSYIGIRAYD
jgi:hypothetical protein